MFCFTGSGRKDNERPDCIEATKPTKVPADR